MKRMLRFVVFVCLFFAVSVAPVLARGGHHGGGHHGYSFYWNLDPYPFVWNYGYYGRQYPSYYSYPPPVYYPYQAPPPVYYPPPSPPPVQRQQYEAPEEPQQAVEERTVSRGRLDTLRTQAARDFYKKMPMPYDTFDSMSGMEREAYGEEWDRLMLVSGGKGPFFKKKWR